MRRVALSLDALIASGDLRPATPTPRAPADWRLSELAGRLVELSTRGASAPLTLTFRLVLDAQRQGEPVVWVTPGQESFYPPDAAEGGIDLDALVVVRVPSPRSVARAAGKLLQSGAFGLIVLDMSADGEMPTPLQIRLAGLAQKHHTALLCLTEKAPEAPSIGSLVAVRVHAERRRIGQDRFVCRLRVLKDKRRGPTWTYQELCRGPAGLS